MWLTFYISRSQSCGSGVFLLDCYYNNFPSYRCLSDRTLVDIRSELQKASGDVSKDLPVDRLSVVHIATERHSHSSWSLGVSRVQRLAESYLCPITIQSLSLFSVQYSLSLDLDLAIVSVLSEQGIIVFHVSGHPSRTRSRCLVPQPELFQGNGPRLLGFTQLCACV